MRNRQPAEQQPAAARPESVLAAAETRQGRRLSVRSPGPGTRPFRGKANGGRVLRRASPLEGRLFLLLRRETECAGPFIRKSRCPFRGSFFHSHAKPAARDQWNRGLLLKDVSLVAFFSLGHQGYDPTLHPNCLPLFNTDRSLGGNLYSPKTSWYPSSSVFQIRKLFFLKKNYFEFYCLFPDLARLALSPPLELSVVFGAGRPPPPLL